MRLFRRKKPKPPAQPWSRLDQREIPLLDQVWTGVYSRRDEALVWLRGARGVEDIQRIFPGVDEGGLCLLQFPPEWKHRRLDPQGWPYYRHKQGAHELQGYVDTWIFTTNFASFGKNSGAWRVSAPQTWRFLRFFFPFFSRRNDQAIRSQVFSLEDSWVGDGNYRWIGSRGLALGFLHRPEDPESMGEILGALVGQQLVSTGYWTQSQDWKGIEPTIGAQGVTLNIRLMLGPRTLWVSLFLTRNFLMDGVKRLVSPAVRDLNNLDGLTSLALLLLIKETLADPEILLRERARIPLSLTLGEFFPWLPSVDRRIFLETLVFGRHKLREVKKLTAFYHQKRLVTDPGFSLKALALYLKNNRIRDWEAMPLPLNWGLLDLQEGNRNFFRQVQKRLASDPHLFSPLGKQIFDTLWTKTEESRYRGLIDKFALNPPFESGFVGMSAPYVQKFGAKILDSEWGILLWAAPSLGPKVQSWFSSSRWIRIQEEKSYCQGQKDRGVLDLARVWNVCRSWNHRVAALVQGRRIDI